MQESKATAAEMPSPDCPHSQQPYRLIAPQGPASCRAVLPNHRKLVGGTVPHTGSHRKALLSWPPYSKYNSVFRPVSFLPDFTNYSWAVPPHVRLAM